MHTYIHTTMVGAGYRHPSIQWPNTPMDERQRGIPAAVAYHVGLGLPGFSWLLVTVLLPVISDHSDLGVSQLLCCLAAGHCLAPCDLGSLGLGSLPASLLVFFIIWSPVHSRVLLHSEYLWPCFCSLGCVS